MLHEKYAAAHISRREPTLDFVRGIAVLLMIAAHAIYFFHNDTSPMLQFIVRSANTVVFTIFLFVSGAAAFYSLTAEDRASRAHMRRVLFHSFVLLIGYYTVAFTIILTRGQQGSVADVLGNLASAALLLRVPSFSEFLIPFVILSLSVLPFSRIYRFLATRPYWAAITALILYVTGVALYPTVLPPPWREMKAIFAGDEGLLRFPIFHYIGVFLAGLAWGRFLTENESISARMKRAFVLMLGSFVVFVLSVLTYATTHLAFLDPLNRWPPSVGFLAAGMTGVFFFTSVIFAIPRIRGMIRIDQLFRYLGADSYDLFVVHLVLLHLYQRFVDWRFTQPVLVLLMAGVLLVTSSVISSLNWKVSPSLFALGPVTFSGLHRHRIRKRYLLLMAVLAGVTLFRINATSPATSGGIVPREGISGQQEMRTPSCGRDSAVTWFYTDYGYCRSVLVANTHPSKTLLKGDVVGVEVDLADLVHIGKALPSGDDLLIVSEVSSNAQPVLQTLVPSGNANAMIFFALVDDIPPGAFDNRYILYYGSDDPRLRPVLSERVITDLPYQAILGAEGLPELSLTKNRRWFLVGYSEPPPNLTITLSVDGENAGKQYRYTIAETNDRGRMERTTDTERAASFDVSAYLPGTYTVVVSREDNPAIRSRSVTFFVSAPLSIAATLDWEGWAVPDTVLSQITDIASRHGNLPITHFFNPRVFLPSGGSGEETQKLVDFLLHRVQTNRDEIALHLHMHFDMIEAAGLTSKTEPSWGYRSDEGYDIETTAYSYNELRQLLAWAKRMFRDHGLPEPVGYRAGGWFADATVLRALRDAGFLYDSSGREKPQSGPFSTIPWNLSATTQPYYPSASDQNQTGFDALSILEVPNNGGNTNEFDATVLLQNLRRNFSGQPLASPLSVVYLSHPQWYTLEFPRLDAVLSGTDAILYAQDRGPAVYTTTGSIYDEWKD